MKVDEAYSARKRASDDDRRHTPSGVARNVNWVACFTSPFPSLLYPSPVVPFFFLFVSFSPSPYLCQLVTEVGRRHLRSWDVHTCTVPRTQSQIGDRSFTAAGPRLWNSLPIEIRRKDITFEHYRRLLKAYLFVYAAAHCDFFA